MLSVKLGYLPRAAAAACDDQLLPPDLDVSAAVPPPVAAAAGKALPPGQYGLGLAAPPSLLLTSLPDAPTGAALLPKRAAAAGSVDAAHLGRRRRGGAVLPPSQRLVRVTGSVREVRVWDALSGVALEGHSGPGEWRHCLHAQVGVGEPGRALVTVCCATCSVGVLPSAKLTPPR